MDLKLDEAGMTFLVGAFVILTVEGIALLIFGRHLIKFFDGRFGLTSDPKGVANLTVGVFAGLSFATGLIVEDMCSRYSDPRVSWPFRFTYATLHLGAASHDDRLLRSALKQAVLIDEFDLTKPKLSLLGHDVFSSGIFSKLIPTRGAEYEDWALGRRREPLASDKESLKEFDKAFQTVFYYAKNRVFLEDNYLDEMQSIQNRLYFSSTISTVSLAAAAVILLASIARMPRIWRNGVSRTDLFKRAATLFATFLAIYVAGYIAYLQESSEFSKRAFGYHDTMLRAARLASFGTVNGSALEPSGQDASTHTQPAGGSSSAPLQRVPTDVPALTTR
jgi:hypothetical protein